MKIVRSRRANVEFRLPVQGGFTVRFQDHKAVLPDEIADLLVGTGGGFYDIIHPNAGDACQDAKVLVIRDTGLGDVLMVTPMLRHLCLDKGAIVDMMTLDRFRPLFDGNPYVENVLALETDNGDRSAYDIVFDLRLVVENAEHTGRTMHRADAFAGYADIALEHVDQIGGQVGDEDRRPDVFLLPDEAQDAAAAIAPLRDTCAAGVVAYVLRSSTGNRNWSMQTHAAVIRALIDAGYGVVMLDHEPQHVDIESGEISTDGSVLDLCGALALREVAAILSVVDAVITPDTGLFHLASAVDTPTLSYFGAFPVGERASHRALIVVNDASCCPLSPCRSYRCLNRDEDGQSRCLAITPEKVLKDLKTLAFYDGELTRHRDGGRSVRTPRSENHAPLVEGLDTDGDAPPTEGRADEARESSKRDGRGRAADDSGIDTAAPRPARRRSGRNAGGVNA